MGLIAGIVIGVFWRELWGFIKWLTKNLRKDEWLAGHGGYKKDKDAWNGKKN